MKTSFIASVLLLGLACIPIRTQAEESERKSFFQFYTNRESNEIRAAIIPNLPGTQVSVMTSNSGTQVSLWGCSKKNALAVKELLIKKWGPEAVQDWCDVTHRTWKSPITPVLMEQKKLGQRLPELSVDSLEELSPESRAALIDDLVYLLENRWRRGLTGRNWQLHQAIRALGNLKAETAIPVLASKIDFLPDGQAVIDSQPTELAFPCALALARIGAPSSEELAALVASGPDSKKGFAAWTLMQIIGLDTAKKKIRELAADNKLNESQATKLIEQLETYQARWGANGFVLKDL